MLPSDLEIPSQYRFSTYGVVLEYFLGGTGVLLRWYWSTPSVVLAPERTLKKYATFAF